MGADRNDLSRENATLKAALAVAETDGLEVVAGLVVARAKASEDMALIAQQKRRIAKLARQVYEQRSEPSARLIDQLALAFEELDAYATEDEVAAERLSPARLRSPDLRTNARSAIRSPTIFPASVL